MSYIDKVISHLSPGWAASRQKNRLLYKAYEAANASRIHKANRESKSADHAVWLAGRSLREQARWLDENHDLAIGVLDKMEERVVGAAGLMIEPQPRSVDGELLDDFAEEIARRWAAWSIRPEVTGTMTRPELERMVLRSAIRDGEVFAQLVRGRVAGIEYPTGTPFAIEALEADFVPENLNEPEAGVINGIRINGWRRPVEYRVLYSHPGNATGIRHKYKAIPAANMLHLANRKRLHQVRGVSLFHGVITRLSDLKEYEEAERVAARLAASLGVYIKKGEPHMYDGNDKGDSRNFDFTPGMTFDDLAPGEEVGMVESNRPNTHLSEFRNGQLRAVAAGLRTGYSTISRDFNGSYSSQRQELVEGFEGYAVLQDWFVSQWSRPVYRAWLEMELLNGLELPPGLDESSLFDAVYMGPVMPWIDPAKESEGWRKQIRGGAAAESEWIRARGKNPREVKAMRKREIEFNRENNLITDTDPANDKGVQDAKNQPQSKTKED